MGNGARGILLHDGVEGGERVPELERMQQRDGAVEVGRDGRRARRLKRHGAELSSSSMLLMLRDCGGGNSQRGGENEGESSHGAPLRRGPKIMLRSALC